MTVSNSKQIHTKAYEVSFTSKETSPTFLKRAVGGLAKCHSINRHGDDEKTNHREIQSCIVNDNYKAVSLVTSKTRTRTFSLSF